MAARPDNRRLPGGLSLAMAVLCAGDPQGPWDRLLAGIEEAAPTLCGFRLSGAAEDGTTFRFGYGAGDATVQ